MISLDFQTNDMNESSSEEEEENEKEIETASSNEAAKKKKDYMKKFRELHLRRVFYNTLVFNPFAEISITMLLLLGTKG